VVFGEGLGAVSGLMVDLDWLAVGFFYLESMCVCCISPKSQIPVLAKSNPLFFLFLFLFFVFSPVFAPEKPQFSPQKRRFSLKTLPFRPLKKKKKSVKADKALQIKIKHRIAVY
jgi:hypothetical protein